MKKQCTVMAIGLLVCWTSWAQAQSSAASAAASAPRQAKRHLLTRTPPTSDVPRSNDPTSPRNTNLGATGDGSGADLSGGPAGRSKKAASAAGR